MIRASVKIILLCLVLGLALVGWDAYRFFTAPLTQEQAQVVQVAPGSSFAAINRQLRGRGLIEADRHARYFSLYARLRGVAHRVQSGEYRVTPGMTPLGLLEAMAAGRTVQYRLTIVEGWTVAQLRAALAEHEAIEHTLENKSDDDLMAALGHPDEKAEGRFLPDTYQFPRGTTDVAFLELAYTAMQQLLEDEWAQRADNLPFDTPYQALILASIVEKETAVPAERKRIAGVFVRRLRQGMPLQTDPTVIYGVPDFDGNLRRSDLRRDNPYNTYTRRGLTPTPIALPGAAAIHAALHPASGDALYFVARGDGSHVFSKTLAEHNRAVRKYQLNQ